MSLELLLLEVGLDVGIDFVFANEADCGVHCRKILTLEYSDLELIELWVKGWGHHDFCLIVRLTIINLGLLIASTGN